MRNRSSVSPSWTAAARTATRAATSTRYLLMGTSKNPPSTPRASLPTPCKPSLGLAFSWCEDARQGELSYSSRFPYFETEPYSGWFSAFEPLLNGLGSSFYKKSSASSRALHTDLCSPVATDPTWSGLDEANRQSLEADGTPLWHKLLEKLQPQVVLLSVAQHYLEHIQFEPLTDWETLHTFTKTANGAPLQQPYSISVRWYNVGGQMCMFAFGRAAQTPFGLLANTHKQEAGKRLLERYGQGCPIVRRFIQFPHPGPEHEPDDPNGKVKSWNERHDLHGRDLDHKRKFMRLRGGEWIDREGRKHKGDLDAWGEWEPESNLISRFNPEDDQLPKYLWEL